MKRIQIRSLLCAGVFCAVVLCAAVLCAAVLPVYPAAADEAAAPDAIDSWDVSAPSEAEALPADTPSGEAPSAEALVPQAVPAQTEPVIPADLVETEPDFEPPADIADGLVRDTPDGEAAELSEEERTQYLKKLFFDNGPEAFLENHGDVSSTFLLLNEETGTFSEYCRTFTNRSIYYSDDWTPGLEELRLLIYGEDGCVEDYAWSQRFVCFLNASGEPYRNAAADPVTLDEDTMDEPLLRIHREADSLFVITQLTESTILRLSLEEPEGEAFYSCLYLLDPDTLEVRSVRISLHEPVYETPNETAYETPEETAEGTPNETADGTAVGTTDGTANGAADGTAEQYTVRDVRNINYSYDHGMSHFVETGFTGLVRHLMPDTVWAPEDLRKVEVTLDPGTKKERVVSLTTLKGDPISYTLPAGYELYRDEALTQKWIDDGDYTSDLSLWAAPAAE